MSSPYAFIRRANAVVDRPRNGEKRVRRRRVFRPRARASRRRNSRAGKTFRKRVFHSRGPGEFSETYSADRFSGDFGPTVCRGPPCLLTRTPITRKRAIEPYSPDRYVRSVLGPPESLRPVLRQRRLGLRQASFAASRERVLRRVLGPVVIKCKRFKI